MSSRERRPERDLVDAGLRDVAREAEELRSGGALRPERREASPAAGTVLEDGEHVDEGLHVVDRRRLPEQPDLDRERRLVARLAALALDRLEEGRLLATDVRAGAAPDLDVEREVRARDRRAEVAGGARGIDRATDARFGERILAADVQEALGGTGGEALDRHRLDDGEWVELHEHPILERARLGLVGVAYDVVRLRGLRRYRRPLAPGRKRRAAAAEQARLGDLADHRLLAHGEGLVEGEETPMGEVVVDRRRIDHARSPQELELRLPDLGHRRAGGFPVGTTRTCGPST